MWDTQRDFVSEDHSVRVPEKELDLSLKGISVCTT